MPEIICPTCDTVFLASEIAVAKGRRFCSVRCQRNYFVQTNTRRPQYSAGDRVGRLTLIAKVDNGRQTKWLVRCDCGNEKVAHTSHMQAGRIVSCRCHRIADKTKHGMADTPEHGVWNGMVGRTGPDHADAHLYFDRGISVCQRWLNGDLKGSGFKYFYEDMGPRPSPLHSLDRIDNNGNYEPGNCRWATSGEQSRNRRQNIFVNVEGKQLCLLDAVNLLAPELGYPCVLGRIYNGWPIEKALTEPKRPGKSLRAR